MQRGVPLQVANGGGFEALLIDSAGRVLDSTYGARVANHEAGHFLIAYLIGILPRSYTLSSLDAFRRWATWNREPDLLCISLRMQGALPSVGVGSTLQPVTAQIRRVECAGWDAVL
jgi:hypothetical protein